MIVHVHCTYCTCTVLSLVFGDLQQKRLLTVDCPVTEYSVHVHVHVHMFQNMPVDLSVCDLKKATTCTSLFFFSYNNNLSVAYILSTSYMYLKCTDTGVPEAYKIM